MHLLFVKRQQTHCNSLPPPFSRTLMSRIPRCGVHQLGCTRIFLIYPHVQVQQFIVVVVEQVFVSCGINLSLFCPPVESSRAGVQSECADFSRDPDKVRPAFCASPLKPSWPKLA